MANPRITSKERNLIKGAIRRVFSRSELRQQVIKDSVVNHTDLTRPRVKHWCLCPLCNKHTPKSYMQVDHIKPVIRVTETLIDVDFETLVNRIWCIKSNLLAICEECHHAKTSKEQKERLANKRKKNGSIKRKD